MATIISRLVITSVVLLMARDISAMSHTRKSSSWPSFRLCLARMTSVIWSMASEERSGSAIWAMMKSMLLKRRGCGESVYGWSVVSV